jgi:hypothetical protein
MTKLEKSEFIKEIVKWAEGQIKAEMIDLKESKGYGDYSHDYQQGKIQGMINLKVSLEKYGKKLKHEYEDDYE